MLTNITWLYKKYDTSHGDNMTAMEDGRNARRMEEKESNCSFCICPVSYIVLLPYSFLQVRIPTYTQNGELAYFGLPGKYFPLLSHLSLILSRKSYLSLQSFQFLCCTLKCRFNYKAFQPVFKYWHNEFLVLILFTQFLWISFYNWSFTGNVIYCSSWFISLQIISVHLTFPITLYPL